MKYSDTNLVIMAGGKSTRTGFLQYLLPKYLAPVYDKNLLFIQLDYAAEAKISNVYISTDPTNFDLVQSTLNSYDGGSKMNITVLKNEFQSHGIVPGLAYLRNLTCNIFYISLSDIYYYKNPFICLGNNLKQTVFGKFVSKNELLNDSGILNINDKIVVEIVERGSSSFKGTKANWNGLFFGKKEILNCIDQFIQQNGNEMPIGDFYQYSLENNTEYLYFEESGDFINNNTLIDLFKTSITYHASKI